MGKMHFYQQKNRQDTFWAGEKLAGCCTVLKMPRGNTAILTYFILTSLNHFSFFYCYSYFMCDYSCGKYRKAIFAIELIKQNFCYLICKNSNALDSK